MVFYKNNFNENLVIKIRFFFIFILLISFIFQILIDFQDLQNIYISTISLLITLIIFQTIFRKEILINSFIPVLVILFSNLGYLSGPLVIKSLFFQKISENLIFPLETFNLIFLFQLCLFISFLIFFHLIVKKRSVSREKKTDFLKIFEVVDKKNFIIMVFIFSVLKIYVWILNNGIVDSTEFSNIKFKFFFGIQIFFYIPLIIYMKSYFFEKNISKNKLFFLIILYFFAGIIFSILSNTRTYFYEFFLILGIFYLILFIFSNFTIKNKAFLFLSCIFLIFIINSLNNMIISTRYLKEELKPLELLKFSFSQRQEVDYLETWEGDEYYTGNITVDRFIFPKFVDKSISLTHNFQEFQIEQYKKFLLSKIIYTIPQNVIHMFDKTYFKERFAMSSGSYQERLNGIKKGNYSQGSNIVDIQIIFEKYSFLIFISYYVIFFSFIQIFQKNEKDKIEISFLILLLAIPITRISVDDSASGYLSNLRIFIEVILFNFVLIRLFNYFNKKNKLLR